MMTNTALQHTKITVFSLEKELTGFWSQDYWNLKFCPLVENQDSKRFACFRFGILPHPLKVELRYACYQRLINKKWSLISSNVYAAQIRKITFFLFAKAPKCKTLLERSLEDWTLRLKTYLVERGEYKPTYRKRIDGQQELRQTLKRNTCLAVFEALYRELENAYYPKPMLERDVWDLNAMGVELNPSLSAGSLTFRGIKQGWLYQAAKMYMSWLIGAGSGTTCQSILSVIRKFSRFIELRHPALQPTQINRQLMLDFLLEMAKDGISNGVRASYLSRINTFLERCIREEWLPIPDKRLVYPDDFPRRERRKPRFIPEYVMSQLMENVHLLEPLYRRMVLVLSEGGMRIGELCTLKTDCLSQDVEGVFFLTYYQWKIRRDHTIPFSRENAGVIQEQLKVNAEKGITSVYVFIGRKGRVVRQDTFSDKLNKLGVECNICDENGALWRFQPHQFRHTVATRMINNNVPQIHVQNYLGHKSAEMTAVYAHMHNETKRREYNDYLERTGKVIDITGRTIEPTSPQDSVDSQLLKKNILAQALPNGYCALPLVQSQCPHANACLTCAHFRTDASFLDVHRQQLQQTTHFVQISRDNGWSRQLEMNERVEKNLKKIIETLEEQEVSENGGGE